jgi:nucleotide-binding universal stress UspA family protein
MIQLQRILVPTDFSDCSTTALRYGVALAERFGSEVHLVHVVQDLVALAPEPGLSFPPPGEYLQELQSSAERSLARLPGDGLPFAGPVTRRVLQGPPFVELIRYAREYEIDLIVMGTHGRSGLAHVLLGSVAERIVRKAPCPVLTVRPEGHQFKMP